MCLSHSIIQGEGKTVLKGPQGWLMEKEINLGYGAPKSKSETCRWKLKGSKIHFNLTRYRGVD